MNSQREYTCLADFYDHLMRKIDYREWAFYIQAIAEEFCQKDKFALELGAGTCKVSNYIMHSFDSLIVTDYSLSMLERSNVKLNKVVCKMQQLPFRQKFDFVYSIFDSVNYLLSEADLLTLFNEVGRILGKDGIFTFDASLENNSINIIQDLNRKGKYKGQRFFQESIYDSESGIHKNKFHFIDKDGNEMKETHIQKIFSFDLLLQIIDSSDLYIVDCYDAFSYNNASKESERVQFVLKRSGTKC